ncbi:hypothetical protein ACFYNY_19950 [Streptomyces sp. NPDC006530]|uniref:hypothetical protein n=1 Tax=Streptomyces sp. NPDC006530 TaxID=3364750 RepID=UPI0036A4AF12
MTLLVDRHHAGIDSQVSRVVPLPELGVRKLFAGRLFSSLGQLLTTALPRR